jgi:hypothetical protein
VAHICEFGKRSVGMGTPERRFSGIAAKPSGCVSVAYGRKIRNGSDGMSIEGHRFSGVVASHREVSHWLTEISSVTDRIV